MPKFIDQLRYNDPQLHEAVAAVADLAMSPGALDGKTKLLIAIALDALCGAKKGVEILAKQAKKAGVTKEEIAEALRLAYFVAGNGVLAVAGEAFEEYEEDDDDDEEDDDDDEKPFETSTLMVFDEVMIDGPSYLKTKAEPVEAAAEEDEYAIQDLSAI